jgi:hypothetical protein
MIRTTIYGGHGRFAKRRQMLWASRDFLVINTVLWIILLMAAIPAAQQGDDVAFEHVPSAAHPWQ